MDCYHCTRTIMPHDAYVWLTIDHKRVPVHVNNRYGASNCINAMKREIMEQARQALTLLEIV